MDDPDRELRVAAQALTRADWRGAARAFGRARDGAAGCGDVSDTARCREMESLLLRRSGDERRALERAVHGGFLGGDELSARFISGARRAEELVAAGDDAAAAAEYEGVVTTGARLDLPGWILAALERRRADRLSACGEQDAAWRAFDAAAGRHRAAGDDVAAGWVALEHANRAWATGRHVHGLHVTSRMELERTSRTDPPLRCELALSRGRLWRVSGDPRAAAAEAGAALDAAVALGAPMSVLPAAVLLAQVREEESDLPEAWAVLASAWGALDLLLGDRLSRVWMGSVVDEVRERWGIERFEEIRAEHARAQRVVLRPAFRRPLS